jgi:hypothetical protein
MIKRGTTKNSVSHAAAGTNVNQRDNRLVALGDVTV